MDPYLLMISAAWNRSFAIARSIWRDLHSSLRERERKFIGAHATQANLTSTSKIPCIPVETGSTGEHFRSEKRMFNASSTGSSECLVILNKHADCCHSQDHSCSHWAHMQTDRPVNLLKQNVIGKLRLIEILKDFKSHEYLKARYWLTDQIHLLLSVL